MAFSHRGPVTLTSLALVMGALVLGAPAVASASMKKPSSSSIIAAATKAIKTETSVHVVATTLTGKQDSKLVANIGSTSGTESYLSGSDAFTITVTPKYAYLSGSQSGLVDLMGLSKAEAKKVGTKSMSMKKGSTPYTTFEENLTSGAFDNLMPPVKGTTLLKARDKTTNGYQLTWVEKKTTTTPKSTTVMTVSSGAKSLPLKETVKTSTGSSLTTFTNWGKGVHVAVPTKLIAYATVFKS